MQTLLGTVKGRAGAQASANTETQPGTVVRLYTDAIENVTAADVRLFGIPTPLKRVSNGSNVRLWKGAEVTVNWSRGSRFAPTILGVSGGESGAVVATATAAVGDAALSTDGDGEADLSGIGLLLAAPDASVPDGYLLVQGANVSMHDAHAAAEGENGTRTISARPLVVTSLPVGNFDDGTVLDLVDGAGQPQGMYRWDAGAAAWRRRDAGSGGGASFGPQPANTFLAGPTFGADAVPTIRTLVTNDLPALGVTSDKLAAAAVTRAKIGTAAVGTSEIADASVTTAKLESSGVVPGTYTNANLTVNLKGVITSVSSGSAGGGSSPTGAASGDLSGNYPGPTVARLQGWPISTIDPTTGQVLKFDGSQWAPAADVSGSGGAYSSRVISGTMGGVLLQSDDAVLLDATPGNTALGLRGNLTASKLFVIKRIDNSQNTCALNVNGFDGVSFPDAGIGTGGGTYSLPPLSGLVLAAHHIQVDGSIRYSIVGAFKLETTLATNSDSNLRTLTSGGYQVQVDDEVLFLTHQGGGFTLPNASVGPWHQPASGSTPGKSRPVVFYIHNVSVRVSISAQSGQTINGSTSSWTDPPSGVWHRLRSIGSGWVLE